MAPPPVTKLVYTVPAIPPFGEEIYNLSERPDNFGNTIPKDKYPSLITENRVTGGGDDVITFSGIATPGVGLTSFNNDLKQSGFSPIFGASFANIFINGQPSGSNPIMSGDFGSTIALARRTTLSNPSEITFHVTSNSASAGSPGTLTIELLNRHPSTPFLETTEDPIIVVPPAQNTFLKYVVPSTPATIALASVPDGNGNVAPIDTAPALLHWTGPSALSTDTLDCIGMGQALETQRTVNSTLGFATDTIVNGNFQSTLFGVFAIKAEIIGANIPIANFTAPRKDFIVTIKPVGPSTSGILYVKLARGPDVYRQYHAFPAELVQTQ